MAVLIKGGKMPRCCNYCAFHKMETVIESVDNGGDYVTYKNIVRCEICEAEDPYMSYKDADTKRRDDCPIVEIPPHGELIDKGTLMESIKETYCTPCPHDGDYNYCKACLIDDALDAIEDAPTVIESEEE